MLCCIYIYIYIYTTLYTIPNYIYYFSATASTLIVSYKQTGTDNIRMWYEAKKYKPHSTLTVSCLVLCTNTHTDWQSNALTPSICSM